MWWNLYIDVVNRVEENSPKERSISALTSIYLYARVDKGMLDQIIYNLLNNAAIHTDPQCKIEITVNCHADITGNI